MSALIIALKLFRGRLLGVETKKKIWLIQCLLLNGICVLLLILARDIYFFAVSFVTTKYYQAMLRRKKSIIWIVAKKKWTKASLVATRIYVCIRICPFKTSCCIFVFVVFSVFVAKKMLSFHSVRLCKFRYYFPYFTIADSFDLWPRYPFEIEMLSVFHFSV